MTLKKILMCVIPVVLMANAHALTVLPASYGMVNGSSGTYDYWDDSYTGSGCKTCNGAQLAGGLGDLTDGTVATQSWNIVEAPAGPGPYVGWTSIDPIIQFHFSQLVNIDSATFHFDDSGIAGVTAPASVTILGKTYSVLNPPGTAPFAFTVSGLGFTGTDLGVTINRSGEWTFASEITFQSPVPEIAKWQMLALGSIFIGIALRRARIRIDS